MPFVLSSLVTQLLKEGEEQAKQVQQQVQQQVQAQQGLEKQGSSSTTSSICEEQGGNLLNIAGSTPFTAPQEKMSWSLTASSQESRIAGQPSSSFPPPPPPPPSSSSSSSSSIMPAFITPGESSQQNPVNNHHSPTLPVSTSSGLVEIGKVTSSTLPPTIPPSASSSPPLSHSFSSSLLSSISSSRRLTPTSSGYKTAGETVECLQQVNGGNKEEISVNRQGLLLSHEQEVQNDWKAILNESEAPRQSKNSETSEEEVGKIGIEVLMNRLVNVI